MHCDIFLDILDPLDEALLEEEAVQQPESKRYTVCICHVMRPQVTNGHTKIAECRSTCKKKNLKKQW